MNLQTIIVLLSVAIALIVSVRARADARWPAGGAVILMALATALWSFSDLLLRQPGLVRFYAILAATIFFSATVAASADLAFVIWQSHRQHWITRVPIGVLLVMPLLTQLLFWIKPWNAILFGSTELHAGTLLFHNSIWGKVVIFYIFSLIGASVVLLWNAFLERPRSTFIPFGVVLLGSLFPLFAAALEFADVACSRVATCRLCTGRGPICQLFLPVRNEYTRLH
jgi:hypothetical protein